MKKQKWHILRRITGEPIAVLDFTPAGDDLLDWSTAKDTKDGKRTVKLKGLKRSETYEIVTTFELAGARHLEGHWQLFRMGLLAAGVPQY